MNHALKRLVFVATLAVISYLTMNGIDAFKHATAESRLFWDVGNVTYAMLTPTGLKSGGTGFLVETPSGNTFILTNRHVCGLQRQNQLLAVTVQGEHYVNLVDVNDGEADLCLLRAPAQVYGKPLRVARTVNYGTKIYLIGHPLLQPMTVKTGFIVESGVISINQCETLMDLLIMGDACFISMSAQIATVDSRGGNSGSAVTDVDGKVVGVLFAGNDQGLSALVPLEQIREYLSRF